MVMSDVLILSISASSTRYSRLWACLIKWRVETNVDAVEKLWYPSGGLERCRHPNDRIREARGRGVDGLVNIEGGAGLLGAGVLAPDIGSSVLCREEEWRWALGGGVGCRLG